jgi:Fe-S-cluster containining protein
MQFIPWRYIADWKCISCGNCCLFYSVVLDFSEWLGIVKNYGVEYTASDLSKLYIRRKSDGSCTFLKNGGNICLCGLQHTKPRACKLWPFKILSEPRFGYPNEAMYDYSDNTVFAYADSSCQGLRLGIPTMEFARHTLREFVEIAVGVRNNQLRTTSTNRLPQPQIGFRHLRGRTSF